MKDKLTKKTIENPNFSVVVPGGCNAKCNFCFWKNTGKMNIHPKYLERLDYFLEIMPPQFSQISLTGGEPTLSPYFAGILNLISHKKRYSHVVLTTNGAKLSDFIENLENAVQHVNLSRHAADDDANAKIFGTKSVPNRKELERLCEELNNIGIDATFNAVLDRGFSSKKDVYNFIEFAKDCGASAVCFRENCFKEKHEALESSALEKEFSNVKSKEYGCPVCRSVVQYVKGMRVTWKYSILEPSEAMDRIYEAVYFPDGRLTEDWAGLKSILKNEIITDVNKMKEKELYRKVDKLYKAVQSLREELKLQEAPYGRDYHQSRRPSNKEDSGSGSNCGGGHC